MTIGYVVLIYCYVIKIKFNEHSKHPLNSLGIYKEKFGINYLKGALIGFTMLSVVCLILVATNNLSFNGIAFTIDKFPILLLSIPMWFIQGASEEVMFRGYMLNRVKNKYGTVFAVIFSSVLFALLHGANIGFTLLAGINLFLIAVLFALTYLKTNSLVITCAMHTAWNFCQGTLYGLEVSGSSSSLAILASSYSKTATDLFTGGKFGPEGGIGVTIVTIITLIIVFVIPDRKKTVPQK